MFPEIYRWEDGSTVHVSAVVNSHWVESRSAELLLFRWSEEVLQRMNVLSGFPMTWPFQVRFSPSGDQPWHLSYAREVFTDTKQWFRQLVQGSWKRGSFL